MVRHTYVTNPPWVAEIIAGSYETLEDTIPPAWLPRLVDLGSSGQRIEANVVEYGCGAYGCALPTVDPNVVLKLTTDTTEAEFAADFAGGLVAPICVKYHMVIKTGTKHKGSRVYLLWRDAAESVGKLATVLGNEAAAYVRRQHKAGQLAFESAHSYPESVARFIGAWVKSCQAMADQTKFPALQPLGAGLVKVWTEQHIVFGDIHEGNLGLVSGRWVITDPGNIAVVLDVDVDPSLPSAAGPADADIILKAELAGSQSQRLFRVSGVHAPFTGEVVSRDEAHELLEAAMPAGFEPGSGLDPNQDFAVIRGVPTHDAGNIVFIVTPSTLIQSATIYGGDLHQPYVEEVQKAWAARGRRPAIMLEILPDDTMYVVEGAEALQVAALDDRPVAIVVPEFDPRWRPPAYMRDISSRLAAALPTPVRAATKMSRP
jgi:hypothetical protein